MNSNPNHKNAQRKIIVMSFLTLDGVMQAPGGAEEDKDGGFQYGGWQMSFFEEDPSPIPENLGKAGGLLLGRKTYEIFASYWPTIGKDIEWFGPFMNNLPKYVASKTLRKTEWQNSKLLEGDVPQAIAKLKEEPGKDIYVLGSGDLCQTLMEHKLIDEFFLMIHPLALGKGKRLFRPDGPKQDLELFKSFISKDGVLVLNYKIKNQ